jgi:hypothetical protein
VGKLRQAKGKEEDKQQAAAAAMQALALLVRQPSIFTGTGKLVEMQGYMYMASAIITVLTDSTVPGVCASGGSLCGGGV